ncbi:MAG: class II D-tagatose-bisphosphate aldolase, non-catalytic subunit [Lentisphaerae bacterium]|nr:class II D-tagatose-bisphosphate aldolase, non-catalytic subunit [Lentisphaerota bacterium]
MPNHITLRDFIAKLKQAGRDCTLLGVGPVSEVVVRAAFQACARHNCPPIFIASRNQVDLKRLGHGYLMGGMDQKTFVAFLKRLEQESAYRGTVFICRDHGGPWQRDAELKAKLPAAQAMAIARRSFRADIAAGFNYLHIDPTKCPHRHTQEQLVQWTVELLAYCETVRRRLGLDAIDYEVGTEDIQGGLTTAETYESFLKKLTARLTKAHLPLPTCVVGQTGTLCKLDRNVGRFDAQGTARLVKIAARYGVGFKEHNGDYLAAAICRAHPGLGITGMNVAPEFGLVETEALLALADLETKLVRAGRLREKKASHLRQLLLEKTFTGTPWKKWMTAEISKRAPAQIKADNALRLLIARVCGHYTYADPAIRSARKRLYANLGRCRCFPKPGANSADDFVLGKVRAQIEFYIRHLAMADTNAILQDG